MTSHDPLFPDIGVIGLVPDTWGAGYWQPRHHVMTRLAKYFRVLWVDPAKGWRQHWLPAHAPGPAGAHGSAPPPPAVHLMRSSRWLPRLERPGPAARWTARRRVQQAVARLRKQGARRFILYLWRPEFDLALDAAPHALSCYHLDDEYTFFYTGSEVDLPVPQQEEALLRRVDEVIVHSLGLLEKKGHYNPNTIVVPNGVNYSAFSTPAAEPQDLRSIPRPRVGYVGIVKDELDAPLLLDLAEHHPEWSLVLVGPVRQFRRSASEFARLRQRRNVHLLGGKPVTALPGYVQYLDVCLLPYLENDYTRYIYPMKLHEYLATGRPVVAKPIRSLQEFGDELRFARSGSEWSDAVRDALSEPPDSTAPAARQGTARRHDWDVLVERIANRLRARLDRPVSDPERPSRTARQLAG